MVQGFRAKAPAEEVMRRVIEDTPRHLVNKDLWTALHISPN
jgi:hypothetical protein